MITCHEVRREGLLQCLEIEPRHIGGELVGRKQALASWFELIGRRGFNSVVVAHETAQGYRPLSFGASIFIRAGFAEAELDCPRPGLADRFIASLSSSTPAILPDYEVTHATAAKPMDVLMVCGSWVKDLHPEQLRQVQLLMPFTFVECHTGYPLRRVLNETISKVQHDFVFSAGVFHCVKRYPECGGSLLMMDGTSASSVSGSMATKLFHYESPILRLRDTEKQLVSQALSGGTDEEIAGRIHLAVASVKKRWQSVFERFETVLPGLFGEGERELNHRGAQKRHLVLAYVRAHPEEFRPYRLSPSLLL